MFCRQCGSPLAEGAKFCRKCGAKVEVDNTVQVSPMAGEVRKQETNAVPSVESGKKKSKKKLWILGAIIAVVIVAAIVLIGVNANRIETNISLTNTYSNEEEGISFDYPQSWAPVEGQEYDNGAEAVVTLSNQAKSDVAFLIEIVKHQYDDRDELMLTCSESFFKENLDDSVLSVTDMDLDGVPVRMVTQITEEGIYYQSYYYVRRGYLYRVNFICKEQALVYLFEEIMDTYTITGASDAGRDSLTKDESGLSDPFTEEDTWISDLEDNAASPDIRFYDIPVSEWVAADKEEVMQWLGDDCTISEYEDWGCMTYTETDIYLRGDGTISSISSYELEELSVDGQSFHSDSDEGIKDAIIELFGQDYTDEDHWLSGGCMSTVYQYPQYTLSFDVSRYDGRWSVVISEPSEEEEVIFGYEEEDAPSSVYIQEPIENYLRLSGSYSASIGQSSLGIGIYTSQEEGEIEIGTVAIYAENGDYFVGTLIPTSAGVYEVVTDTGEEVILIEVDSDDAVTLDMYVDGQYLEEYWMTEHYVP